MPVPTVQRALAGLPSASAGAANRPDGRSRGVAPRRLGWGLGVVRACGRGRAGRAAAVARGGASRTSGHHPRWRRTTFDVTFPPHTGGNVTLIARARRGVAHGGPPPPRATHDI